MHPSYLAHDRKYRQFRQQGQAGWWPAEEYEKFAVEFEPMLHRPYVPAKGKLLELGCGAGNRGLWLAEKGYEVHGVDIAPAAAEWARELAAERGVPCGCCHLG